MTTELRDVSFELRNVSFELRNASLELRNISLYHQLSTRASLEADVSQVYEYRCRVGSVEYSSTQCYREGRVCVESPQILVRHPVRHTLA
jgi:hypothetical protein